MNRVRILLVLVVALLAGGGLAAGTYSYLQNVPTKTVSMPTRPVVVARANLALASELRADDLTTVQWPEGSVPDGAFSDPQQLVGRGLIAAVVQHEPILPGKLASKEAGSGLPPIIPEGKRAVSVKVNEVVGVAGFVVPGTRVDVMVTLTSRKQQSEDSVTRVVVSNAQVLTAGTKYDQEKAKEGAPIPSTVVTLLVTPEDGERIALAASDGQIMLALRNPLDTAPTTTTGVRTAGLLGGQAAAPAAPAKPRVARASAPARPVQAEPAPAQPAKYTVEAIRGAKRSEETVR